MHKLLCFTNPYAIIVPNIYYQLNSGNNTKVMQEVQQRSQWECDLFAKA